MKPSILERILMVLSVLWRRKQYTFFVVSVLFGPLYYAITRVCLWLDPVFFRGINTISITQPVIIIGHPRSGTTFFQRLISKSGNVAMFKAWEMFFPSLIERNVFAPIIRLVSFFQGTKLQDAESGHEIRLEKIDEDEALYIHSLDTDMISYFAPGLMIDKHYEHEGLRLGWDDEKGNIVPIKRIKDYFKRQIYYTGNKKIISNSNPSVFRLKMILRVFPDAKIVYIHRSPEETIPSFLSLIRKYVGNRVKEREEAYFFEKKYQWCKRLYLYFEEVKQEIPQDQLLILPFEDIVADTISALKRFFSFAGVQPEDNFWKYIKTRLQKSQEKHHSNDPIHSFGISGQRIRSEVGFLNERYKKQ